MKLSKEWTKDLVTVDTIQSNKIFKIRNLITEAECEEFMNLFDATENIEFIGSKDDSYQYRDRIVITMEDVVNELWERIHEIMKDEGVSAHTVTNPKMTRGVWEATGLADKVKLVRYGPGGHVNRHCDSYFEKEDGTRSFWTLIVYLNTVHKDQGGGTTFIDHDQVHPESGGGLEVEPESEGGLEVEPESGGGLEVELESGGRLEVELESGGGLEVEPESEGGMEVDPESGGGLEDKSKSGGGLKVQPESRGGLDVQPESGAALLFFQPNTEHEGKALISGEKYLLLTDVLFSRKKGSEYEPSEQEAEALQLYGSAQDLEASGQPHQAWRLFARAFKLWPELERETGDHNLTLSH